MQNFTAALLLVFSCLCMTFSAQIPLKPRHIISPTNTKRAIAFISMSAPSQSSDPKRPVTLKEKSKSVARQGHDAAHRDGMADTRTSLSGPASQRPAKVSLSPGGGGYLGLEPAARPIVDIGINLCHKSFQKSLPDIVQRALKAQVTRMVITGTSLRSSIEAIKLSNDSSLSMDPLTGARVLYATAGVHPHDAKEWTPSTRDSLCELYQDPACVAVGECGLDFNRMFSPLNMAVPTQMSVFEEQVQLAVQFGKPLFCHEREAHAQFLEVLDRVPGVDPKRVCVHCFTGMVNELQEYVRRGYYIGFTGCISDNKRGKALRELVGLVPLSQTMIETDAPFMMPTGMKGRNEPSNLPAVLRTVAQCHGVSEEDAALATTSNAVQFFGLNP